MPKRAVPWDPHRPLPKYPWYQELWWWIRRQRTSLEILCYCTFRFFHRIWRYRKALAYDYDFDSTAMVEYMRLKFLAMAEAFEHGHLLNCERRARQCRVAAELCRRLVDDNFYWQMHENSMGRSDKYTGERVAYSAKEAQRYLGLLIGKYLTHWWD